ncbi:MAG: metal-dependent hydrolase [Thermoprotei archaeon]
MSAFSFYLYLYKVGYSMMVLSVSLLFFILFSNAPDFDILHSKGTLFKKLIRTTFLIPFYIVAKVTHDSIAHRHITHSIKGIIIFLFFVLFLWRVFYAFLYLFTGTMNIVNVYTISLIRIFMDPLIPFSIITSYVLHILGDAVTVTGVQLFNDRKSRGFIVTGKNDDYYVLLYIVAQLISMICFLRMSEMYLLVFFSIVLLVIFIIVPIIFVSKNNREHKYHV